MIDYNTIRVNKINQFSDIDSYKGVYFGLIEFKKIKNSIAFTYRKPVNEYVEPNNISKKLFTELDTEYFQRLLEDKRTLDIVDFLIKEIKNKSNISFPTSFIFSLPITEIETKKEYESLLNLSEVITFTNEYLGIFINDINDKSFTEIIIPELYEMLIVDGQHRLGGLNVLYYAVQKKLNQQLNQDYKIFEKTINQTIKKIEESELLTEIDGIELLNYIDNFQLSSTILIDFDIYEQGKVFADVNFNQKPVNRSLYYDIYGSFPNPDKNEIYLLHKWCILLNTDNKSKLKNKFKLLGKGDGYISQAFFCDSLLPLLRKKGIWYDIANDYTLDRKDASDNIYLFLRSFFNALERKYKYSGTNKPYLFPRELDKASSFNSILLKTTGLGALIKLIPNIFEKVTNLIGSDTENLEQEIFIIFESGLSIENLSEIYNGNDDKIKQIPLKITGEYYFSKDTSKGNFSGGAGKGLQDLLYKELMTDLKFEKKPTKKQVSLF